MLALITGGVFITTGNLDGIYVIVGGILASILKAMIDAWVLLIEIHR